jgi:TonB family protein
MKKTLFTFILILSLFVAKGQTTDTINQVFTFVEKSAEFPGGLDKLYLYLQNNIDYPIDSYKKNIQGKVFVTFVVERDGSLTNVAILRGVSPDIDAEAIKVVRNSPKWSPGIQNGKPVRVQFSMAINFKLPQKPGNDQHLMDSVHNLPPDQKIFTSVEQMPAFPGGARGFRKYLEENLKYPDKAREDNINGQVRVSFIVEKDGSLSGIRIANGLSPETDTEALRIMNSCPKWIAGTQHGVPVRVAYSLSIPFPFN